MGYRSDVAYTIRFVHDDERVAAQTFYTFLAEAKSKPEYSAALDDEALEIDEKRRRINFSAQNIKWYSSYPEVAAHEALIKLAGEWCEDDNLSNLPSYHPPACAFMFYRIGEEEDDIARECGGNYGLEWINLVRTMETDWS
jgi:hypothetical protein